MAKPIKVNVTVDENGKILVAVQGTEGTECLKVLAFLDDLPDFTVTETERVSSSEEKKAAITVTQKIEN